MEMTGALRRRTWRVGGGVRTVYEVEVRTAERVGERDEAGAAGPVGPSTAERKGQER
ncbi:hypothetical protein [Nocardiopsis sp. CNR-923]|uniref:hypothetical protein n=1 Tax=Nocardiopsis sp. CNR-923 TaxID=1904965 RepID=UPI0021CD0164|nr:hypothetical protein [Nocardiopsis sp. CNR-923]